jgi:hypothetical protein
VAVIIIAHLDPVLLPDLVNLLLIDVHLLPQRTHLADHYMIM